MSPYILRGSLICKGFDVRKKRLKTTFLSVTLNLIIDLKRENSSGKLKLCSLSKSSNIRVEPFIFFIKTTSLSNTVKSKSHI